MGQRVRPGPGFTQRRAPLEGSDSSEDMPRLTVITAEGSSEFELQPHNTVGRHPNNSVQVLDRIVSKEHCHIDLVGDAYVLKDLGSLNGTYVNGERTRERKLAAGDEITLGAARMIFDPIAAGVEAASAPQTDPKEDMPAANGGPGRPTWPRSADGAGPSVQVVPQSGGDAIPDEGTLRGAAGPPARLSKVTMTVDQIESHIHTRLAAQEDRRFLPEGLVSDTQLLRADYEKLRVAHDLSRAIGSELDVDRLLEKILDCAFLQLKADRGVVLLLNADGEPEPRCIRVKGRTGTEEEVKLSSTIVNEVIRDKSAVLSNDASVDARFSGAQSIIMQGIRSTMAVPLLSGGEVLGLMVLDSQVATNAFHEKDLELFQNVAAQAAIAIQNGLYAEKIEREALTRERFQRLLSPAIAELVISGEVEVKKGGELRDTTVLFTDIRGFTRMSESQTPQTIVDMLNEYFERMVEIVFRHQGTLDKFVGDEIMALYGAPVHHADAPYSAVVTGLEMLEELERFNVDRAGRGEERIDIGVGVNTGEIIAGYLGSSRALEYTVIGDAVNTGARLCAAAKGGQILISDDTHARVSDRVRVEQLPPIQAKGKSQPVPVFEVLGLR